jgi:hypothetical protein
VDSKKGGHLGHIPGGTQKNSLWVKDATSQVKLGYHLRFDEGMNNLTLAELPPSVKIFLHSGAAPSIEDVIGGEDSNAMMFYSTDCPFKSERTFMVKISCKHPTFSIVINMDGLFHRPWISNVSKSKKTTIYSIFYSARLLVEIFKAHISSPSMTLPSSPKLMLLMPLLLFKNQRTRPSSLWWVI